jgi:two-component system nitrate/nitrite response regulator NarL
MGGARLGVAQFVAAARVARRALRARLTRVFVVAAVRFYEEGLSHALHADARFDVVGSARGIADAVEQLRTAREPADVALLDAALDEGTAAVRALHGAAPTLRVVVLAVRGSVADAVEWAEAGVAGFVECDESLDALLDKVDEAARGETRCSPQLTAALIGRVATLAEERRVPGRASTLTSRELQIAGLLERGLSNKEIAASLRIGLPTVKNHVHSILEKLQVTRRGEAAAVLRGPVP